MKTDDTLHSGHQYRFHPVYTDSVLYFLLIYIIIQLLPMALIFC